MTTRPLASFDEAYYATFYRDYERQNPPRKLACYRSIVAGSLPSNLTSPKILDLGCGFGRFVAALDPDWQAYGADVSEFAVSRASTAVPGVRFAVMREGTIPFAERFDAITAWDVLEHIPDLDDIAAQVTDQLVANGVFAFAVPVYDGPLGHLVNWLDKDTTHVHRAPRRF
jgi:SAM-dependent methyltransferase